MSGNDTYWEVLVEHQPTGIQRTILVMAQFSGDAETAAVNVARLADDFFKDAVETYMPLSVTGLGDNLTGGTAPAPPGA